MLAGFERARKRLLAESELEAWEGGIREQFAENRTDAQARAIVREFIESGKPFVLFLRSFSQESYDVIKPETPNDPQRRRFGIWQGVSDIEERLSRGFGQKVAVLAIANPYDLMMKDLQFPRLELFGGRWTEAVDGLVRAASFIVLNVETLAPGISIELHAIRRHGRQKATVIILVKERDQTVRHLHEAMGAEFPKHEWPNRNSARFAGLPRISLEDEIPFHSLQSSPLFADLLADYDVQARTPADPNVLRNRAFLANAWGVYLLSVDRVDEAVASSDHLNEAARVFWKALRLYVEARDTAGMADTLINIGRSYLDARQYADAIQAFRDSGTYYRARLRDERGFRGAVVWVALAHLLSGDRETALGYLFNLLKLERRRETGVSVDALDLMCKIYRDAGDLESAKRCLADLRAAERRAERRAKKTARP